MSDRNYAHGKCQAQKLLRFSRNVIDTTVSTSTPLHTPLPTRLCLLLLLLLLHMQINKERHKVKRTGPKQTSTRWRATEGGKGEGTVGGIGEGIGEGTEGGTVEGRGEKGEETAGVTRGGIEGGREEREVEAATMKVSSTTRQRMTLLFTCAFSFCFSSVPTQRRIVESN